MNQLKINLKIILFILIAPQIIAQNFTVIKGKIQDKKTGEALPFANIYVNNTTIGTQTDEKGEFSLKVPVLPNLKFIASYVGYQSLEKAIQESYNLLELLTDDKQLNEVKVSSQKDKKWNRQYQEFENAFLGNSEAARMCKILRPYEIDFEKTNLKLAAKSPKPIEIENRYLGYRVFWYLRSFENSPTAFSMLGNSRFELLTPKDEKEANRWQKNREETYKGSLTHFLSALYRGSAKAEGYQIFLENVLFKGKPRQANFGAELSVKKTVREINPDSLVRREGKKCYLKFDNQLEVHFAGKTENQPVYTDIPYQVSWLDAEKKFIGFDAFGILEKPSDIAMSGSMSAARIADLLPVDFQFIGEKLAVISQKKFANFQEKAVLFTHRSAYHLQERIWVKALMFYQNPFYRDSLSRVLHVDLISPKNKILTSQIWEIQNGEAYGDFLLADTLETGIYHLRAYTNYMRNFGDSTIFYTNLPILSKNERILAKKASELPNEQISITLKNKQISINDSLDIQLKGLSFQTYSVAVLDRNSAGNIDFSMPNFYEKAIEKITFPVEKSLTINGVAKDKNGKPSFANLSILNVKNKDLSSLETDENGNFSINNQWAEDTLKLLIKATDAKGKKLRNITILEQHLLPILIPNLSKITILKDSATTFIDNEFKKKDGSILLNEVSVKARREEIEALDRTNKIYGKPDHVVKAAEFANQVSDENLITFLQGRVPGVKIDVRSGGVPGQNNYVVRIRGQANFAAKDDENGKSIYNEPLVLVDGVPFPNIDDLASMSVSQIDRIEVITKISAIFGARGANGIIAIYTKNLAKRITENSFDNSLYRDFQTINIPAFTTASIFTQSPNQQATLYWNPSIFSDKNGEATIKISAGNRAANYIIQVVGIDTKGKVLISQKNISISTANYK